MTDATTPAQPRQPCDNCHHAFDVHALDHCDTPFCRCTYYIHVGAQARPAVAPLALNPEAEEALDRILGPAVASEGLRAALHASMCDVSHHDAWTVCKNQRKYELIADDVARRMALAAPAPPAGLDVERLARLHHIARLRYPTGSYYCGNESGPFEFDSGPCSCRIDAQEIAEIDAAYAAGEEAAK